jgi:cysteine-S-conjugate beta-lyase
MKTDSKLTSLGRQTQTQPSTVNLPIIRASTVTFDSVAHMDDIQKRFNADEPMATYGITNMPLKLALENMACEIEGGNQSANLHAQAYSSGLAAVAAGLLSQIKAGDHVLITDSCYSPTRRLANSWLPRYGIDVTYFKPTLGADELRKLMRPNTTVVYLESPGSLTFELQDIPALSAIAHEHGAVVVMDNAWATGLYFPAFERGVDVVIVPATKYYAGHSDVLVGIVVCTKACWPFLRDYTRDTGQTVNSDDCFLTLRGLRTLHLRLPHHQKTALKITTAIEAMRARFPCIKRVLYPALPSDPGYAIWKRDFKGATGLFAVEVEGTREQMAPMVDHYQYFKLGYSWGGYESLVSIAYLRGMRVCDADSTEKPTSIVRFHVGLEDADDLLADLVAGFERLDQLR